MSACTRPFFHTRALCLAVLAAGMVFTAYAQAQVALTQLSTDTFTDTPSQHETEVEPGTFSYGSTIVSAFQVARIYSGGGADIGFATSTDAGTSWTNGYLPGITIYQGGTHSAASDAAVAYDAMHGVWLIATLPIASNTSVAVSRSADGLTWGDPITIKGSASADKNWIVCDNTSTSPYYGHCYAEWDNTNDGDLIQMSTSTDGGQTWGSVMATAAQDYGIGGVPVVQPKGIVIVPILGFAGNGEVTAYTSTNGGASWTKAVERRQLHQSRRGRDPPERRPGHVGHRRRRQGVRVLARLPLPRGLHVERHCLQHFEQRHQVVGGQARADRCRFKHRRSLYYRHGDCTGHEGSQGADCPRVLLLSRVEMRE
jgi:hypothetical protein